MESNLVEIKRFLKDYKVSVTVGSILVAVLFTVALAFLDKNKEEEAQEWVEDYNFEPSEVMNNVQPAYFQYYLETEDGIAYGNSSIFSEYFNLKSIKEEAKQVTQIDLDAVEEEIHSKKLSDEISIINVTRDGSSYLFTASFNLGNEQDNLKLAEYYFDLLFKDELGLLEDKNTYIFTEPTIARTAEIQEGTENLIDGENNSAVNIIFSYIKNIVVGLILGIVFTIGLVLLKVIYGKKLNYSFAYDVAEEDKFLLYDENLKNEEILAQFIAAPIGSRKVIVTQEDLDKRSKEIISKHKGVVFNQIEHDKTSLRELKSLSQLELTDSISEVIIVVVPKVTTRKWYKVQQQLANINSLSTKVVQINE